ncbi:MAG: hypothetical protein M3472_05965 [Chloroflexota bacterium]|nr:hypothetical protein [Chloroflexota bacterium]
MTGHPSRNADRDLDVWVQEVTEDWRMPRLRSDEAPWQVRLDRSASAARFAPASLSRTVGAVAAAAVLILVSVMLIRSLPAGPEPGPGGRGTDTGSTTSPGPDPSPPAETSPAASPSPAGDTVPRGEGSDALFSLSIQADRGHYAADAPIEIDTTLRYIGDARTTVTSSGAGLVVFSIEQLDGPVDASAGRDLDCARFDYRPGEEEPVEFQKSGGYSNDDPMADFWRTFFTDPQLRLPAGEYRITARANYYVGAECASGREQVVEASVVIVVE